jgi:hypothetical protein
MGEERRYPLKIVFEMFELATGMVAARYRREHPDASDAEVEAVVAAWISDRPGAPGGDAPGVARSVPRS